MSGRGFLRPGWQRPEPPGISRGPVSLHVTGPVGAGCGGARSAPRATRPTGLSSAPTLALTRVPPRPPPGLPPCEGELSGARPAAAEAGPRAGGLAPAAAAGRDPVEGGPAEGQCGPAGTSALGPRGWQGPERLPSGSWLKTKCFLRSFPGPGWGPGLRSPGGHLPRPWPGAQTRLPGSSQRQGAQGGRAGEGSGGRVGGGGVWGRGGGGGQLNGNLKKEKYSNYIL